MHSRCTDDSQGDASTSGAGADAPASDGGDRAATAGEPPPAAPARRGVLRLVLSAAAATLRGLQRVADTMLGVLLPLSWHEALKGAAAALSRRFATTLCLP